MASASSALSPIGEGTAVLMVHGRPVETFHMEELKEWFCERAIASLESGTQYDLRSCQSCRKVCDQVSYIVNKF